MRAGMVTFEGTWEDLQKLAPKLVGRRLRVTVIGSRRSDRAPRRSSAAALVRHAVGWAGDDFEACLKSVHDNRLKAEP